MQWNACKLYRPDMVMTCAFVDYACGYVLLGHFSILAISYSVLSYMGVTVQPSRRSFHSSIPIDLLLRERHVGIGYVRCVSVTSREQLETRCRNRFLLWGKRRLGWGDHGVLSRKDV